MSDLTTCDLCGDQPHGPLHLLPLCHLTAPLRASVDRGVLTLRCYLPECDRVVTTFNVDAEAELDRLRRVAEYQEAEIANTLATALYGDPNEAGEHTAETLADEAVNLLGRVVTERDSLHSLLAALAVDLAKWDRECCGHGLAAEYRAWAEGIRDTLSK